MHLPISATTLVAMPGTGSDADFARRAFGPVADELGIPLVASPPRAPGLVAGHLATIDAVTGPVILAGVSLGAAIAASRALRTPAGDTPVVAVLAALPPWSGAPGDAPAALSARITAAALAADGLDATIAAMVAGSPAWLGAELSRSWRALGTSLAASLTEAAAHRCPTPDDLATLDVPLAVAVAVDDPVHPAAVGRAWAAAAPRGAVAELTLADIGRDPAALGLACLRAWRSPS